MARCVIIGPLYGGEEAAWLAPAEGDLLMAADGGWAAALRHGLSPAVLVGDFDSMPEPEAPGVEILRLPVRKDDTDTVACLKEGRRRGYGTFLLVGCMGGRFDHTLSNLQCLADCALRGESAWMCDAHNRVTVLAPGSHRLPPMSGRKLSLLAFTPEVRGVTLTGVSYPLADATLTSRFPLGCSNEITSDEAALSFTEGLLVVTYSEDL